jgi:proline iminopeptidase
VEQDRTAGDILFPPIEPYRRDWLAVGGSHRIYFEESGNPAGFPVLFVHGGPGSRSRPVHRGFFDPAFYRIVLFDQRGCGLSTPLGSTIDNTTSHLVADIEQLRRHLGVDRWLLFGGSWGSTLSLACAIAVPDRVAGMVLRGVFLGSHAEVDWYLEGLRRFFPEAWTELAGDAAGTIVENYRRLIDSSDPEIALAAARRWCDYESRVIALGEPSSGGDAAATGEILAGVKVQLHFLANDCFLRPDELLDNLWRIGTKPAIIVQGRMDMLCPPAAAAAVAQRLPGAELRMVANGGHSALQPAIATELRAAAARIGQLLAR